MRIRKTTIGDLPRVMQIFDIARAFMRRSGNSSQWNDGYPSEGQICSDIDAGVSYVMTDAGRVIATFAFIIGDEPNYAEIDGRWPTDAPYGTIHRIASDNTAKGIADECLKFCKTKISEIRIDTHRDNAVMLGWINRSGFKYCGVIHVADGTPRLAFQLSCL